MISRIGALAVLTVGVAFFSVVSLAQQPSATTGKDGKAIFLGYKCNSCHTMQSLGITRKKVAGEEEEEGKKKPPDLSSVGLERKAAWMQKFLLKQETIDGERHRRKFKGTDQELQTLTTWLEAQKAPKKKGSK